jgi:hypothetical protein
MAWDGAAAWHRRPSASFDRLSFDFAQDSRLRMMGWTFPFSISAS